MCRESKSRNSSGSIRERIKTRGMIGIYSPVHRIGKTRFAMNLGQKLSEKAPVLYLNLEGYSGGGYYLPRKQIRIWGPYLLYETGTSGLRTEDQFNDRTVRRNGLYDADEK